jgi:hypothetical protein
MRHLLLITLALTGLAAARPRWNPSDWYRLDHNPQVKTQRYYDHRNGWLDDRGGSVRYDNNGNGVIIPPNETAYPWSKADWHDDDSNHDGRLSPDELRWMRRRGR